MYLKSDLKRNLNRSVLFFAMCLAFTVSQTHAAVNVDPTASSNGQFDITGVTSVSWSHTVGNNLSRALYVSVATSTTVLPAAPTPRVTGVTYGGTALTLVGTEISDDNNNSVEIYRLNNPTSGSAIVEVSLIAGIANYVLGGATSFSGVDLANPNGTFTSATGNDTFPTVVVPDGVAGDVVLDTVALSPSGGFVARGAGQDLQFEGRSHFSFAFDVGAGSTEAAMSPVTMSWNSVSNDNWAIAGIAVKSLPITSAPSDISGRIKTLSGRSIPYSAVTLQNLETGEEFYVTSNHFGYYRFSDLETGRLYRISVAHGRYSFTPGSQIIEITESLTDLDFIGSEFGNHKNRLFTKRSSKKIKFAL